MSRCVCDLSRTTRSLVLYVDSIVCKMITALFLRITHIAARNVVMSYYAALAVEPPKSVNTGKQPRPQSPLYNENNNPEDSSTGGDEPTPRRTTDAVATGHQRSSASERPQYPQSTHRVGEIYERFGNTNTTDVYFFILQATAVHSGRRGRSTKYIGLKFLLAPGMHRRPVSNSSHDNEQDCESTLKGERVVVKRSKRFSA